MAFEVKKINPLDLQPRKAIGFSLPFSGRAVFNQTFQSRDAIKANLINFFLTMKGERYMNPSLGTDLQKFLFENINDLTVKKVDASIRESLSMYFPTLIVQEISLQGDPDQHTVTFYLQYTISETNIEDELILNIEQ